MVRKGKLARPKDPILGSLFVDKESRFANYYSFTFNQGLSRGRGKQAKLAPDRRGKSVVTEVDYRTGVGENIAKGSISDSSPTVNSRDSILFLLGKTENSIAGEALVVAGGGGKA